MSPDQPLHQRLLHTAKEYLTHWFSAGVVLTLTGFTPDHWVERLFHAVHLDSLRGAFIEYQFLAVYAGVTFLIVDAEVRNRKRQFEPAAAPSLADASALVTAPADAPVIKGIEGEPSIAVLPFVNMSKDPDQEYFADGITEDIITGLSCDSRLFVTARNSTFVYRGQSVDIRTVGKELGVRYVLEGSIRPVNDQLRITVQLIDTANGNHVWADKIDRPAAEIFAISDEVVDSLVMALCSNLGVAEAKRAGRQRPEDLQAWALVAQAADVYFIQPGAESLLAAEKLLRRAAEIEPSYGASWALLAFMASWRGGYGLSADPVKDTNEAITLASKALSLARQDPLVLGYSGVAFARAGQTAQGIDCLERSLEINPNSGLFRLFYGVALSNDARPEAGIAQLDQFYRLSPKDPHAGFGYQVYVYCYLALNDFQQAEQAARKTVKLIPGFGGGYALLAVALMGLGRAAEAGQIIQKLHQVAPGMTRQGVEDFWRLVHRSYIESQSKPKKLSRCCARPGRIDVG